MPQSNKYWPSSDDEFYGRIPSEVLDPKFNDDIFIETDHNISTLSGGISPQPTAGPSGRWTLLTAQTPSFDKHAPRSPVKGKATSQRDEAIRRALATADQHHANKPPIRATPEKMEPIRRALAAADPAHANKDSTVLEKAMAQRGQGYSTPQKNRILHTTSTNSGCELPHVLDITRIVQMASDIESEESESEGSLFDAPNAPSSAATSRTTSFQIVDTSKSPKKRRSTERPSTPSTAPTRKIPRTPSQGSPSFRREASSLQQVERPLFPSPAKLSTPQHEPATSSVSKGEATKKDLGLLEHIFCNIHLKPYVIEHDAELQQLYDENGVSWGTSFILSQGRQSGRWTNDAIKEKIHRLAGTDGEKMHLVPYIMSDREAPKWLNNSIGLELDREQKAILENRGRGLGLMGPWEGADNWFGGNVRFNAVLQKRIHPQDNAEKFHIRLEGVEMLFSNRFTRALGSRRFIQIHVGYVPSNDAKDVASFLSRKFVLNGRIFIPIPPKDGTLYAIEIDEDYERLPIRELGDHLRWSFGRFLHWHNPIELNKRQPLVKYFARIALGASKSIPAIEFTPSNIFSLEDGVTEDCPPGKPPAEKTLTDGCGLINYAALCQIAKNVGYKSVPTAIQARVAGAKGVWLLHPDDDDHQPKIWIRPSQSKIKYERPDRAHHILDLLCAGQVGSPPNLSRQLVVNLWSNGVRPQLIEDLMRSGLEEITKPLTSWGHGVMDMEALWDAVSRTAKTTSSRLGRLGGSKSRAIGLTGQEFEKDAWLECDSSTSKYTTEEAKDNANDSATADSRPDNSRDQNSGKPSSFGEVAIEMLQSGFHPSQEPYMAEAIKRVLEAALNDLVYKCHVPLPDGTAFKCLVVADPLGVLEPDEIYYKSSEGFTDPETGITHLVLTGDVLIGRYPLRLPSDIQRVKAVDKSDRLSKYQDVLVVPIRPRRDGQKGLISFMNILGGGDLDGDMVFLIRLREIVESFQSKPLTIPTTDIEGQNFEKKVYEVTSLVDRLEAVDVAEAQFIFQNTSLSTFPDGKFKSYSGWHDDAVAKFGLEDERAVRLGYMFNILLDGPKTGFRLKNDVYQIDQVNSTANRVRPKGRYIIDILSDLGKRLTDAHLNTYDTIASAQRHQWWERDADLLVPLEHAKSLVADTERPVCSKYYKQELDLIKAHIDKVYSLWQSASAEGSEKPSVSSEYGYSHKNTPSASREGKRSNKWREVSAAFAKKVEGVKYLDQDEVKASYAYEKNRKFGFHVAFQTLLCLKASARPGGLVPSIRSFDQMRAFTTGGRKLFSTA
uniref:RNA-dependent RNA polymerase n=2 Tax=Moniliophthora roreri TaxID=221103 RepID=A0A0W0F1S2_MONRR